MRRHSGLRRLPVATANSLATLIQDYDWADEVLHARIGRKRFVAEIRSQVEALACGDRGARADLKSVAG